MKDYYIACCRCRLFNASSRIWKPDEWAGDNPATDRVALDHIMDRLRNRATKNPNGASAQTLARFECVYNLIDRNRDRAIAWTMGTKGWDTV